MKLSNGFTPRQRDILGILDDGESHSFGDMMKRLGYLDEEQRTLITHISVLRSSLRPHGQYIVTERMPNGMLGYRRVVLFTQANAITEP
jgi:hypothetical protein